MPQNSGKGDLPNYGRAFVQRLQKRIRSLYEQDFAEITIADTKAEGALIKNGEIPQRDSQGKFQDSPGEGSQGIPKRAPRDPKEEEIHRMFIEMRRLSTYSGRNGGFYNRRQAASFYRQAKFMEAFEDDFEGNAPFSMYFPDYQMMDYHQLRTYFTWRSNVRRGVIKQTSFSYVFIYIYELLNGIGAQDSGDGLEKLLFLWEEYGRYEKKLGRYMAGWVKDYYILHGFEIPFIELVKERKILQTSFNLEESGCFAVYSPFSEYKFAKSIFYSTETEPIVSSCFQHVVKALNEWLRESGAYFDDLIYYSHRGSAWVPFQKALFHEESIPAGKDRIVQISQAEVYWYESGRWYSSKNRVRRENARHIIGYIIKRIEQFYRKAMHFKYTLKADPSKINRIEIEKIAKDGDSFFTRVDRAIAEHYKKTQKISVTVDKENLEKIRENARIIQERLLVESEEALEETVKESFKEPFKETKETLIKLPKEEPLETTKSADILAEVKPELVALPQKELQKEPAAPEISDPWQRLCRSFTAVEREAVWKLLAGGSIEELYAFAQSKAIMLEVLIDSVNEKAVGIVEDTVIEFSDGIRLYDEYRIELERVVADEAD